MTTLKWDALPYSYRNRQATASGAYIWLDRKGWLLRCQDEAGHWGLGEIALLPGYQAEGEALASEALTHLLNGEDWPAIAKHQYPACYAGIELATLDYQARKNEKPLAHSFGPNPLTSIGVTCPITDVDADNAMISSRNAVVAGYTTIKIKIGAPDFQHDFFRVIMLRREIGRLLQIRIDAQSAWDRETAAEHLSRFEGFNIEFMIQPTSNLDDLLWLAKRSPIPLAVDEALLEPDAIERLLHDGSIKFWIIKPAVLGGLKSVQLLHRRCKMAGVHMVFGATRDRGIWTAAAAQLAAGLDIRRACDLTPFTAGRYPSPWIDYQIKKGRVHLPGGPGLGFTLKPEVWDFGAQAPPV